MEDMRSKILALVQNLADEKEWTWTRMLSYSDAANTVLMEMAKLGIIEHREHQLGGHVWIFEGKVFGRTDGVVLPNVGLKPVRK